MALPISSEHLEKFDFLFLSLWLMVYSSGHTKCGYKDNSILLVGEAVNKETVSWLVEYDCVVTMILHK